MADFNLKDALQDIAPFSNKTSSQRDNDSDGFTVPPTPSADGSALPSSSSLYLVTGKSKRNLIHWFIPDMGLIKMYVNPENITTTDRKEITQTRTKGGYNLQYWGEALTELRISGTTGSSGIEGINVLHELYRAEQYAFDSVGLTLASQSSSANVDNSFIGNLFGGGTDNIANTIFNGISGIDPANNNISPKNLPNLSTVAFGIEMFYMGWVYHGYFSSFNFTESATDFLMHYDMTFIATQRRGYRTNYFPWTHNATNGPSGISPATFSGRLRK